MNFKKPLYLSFSFLLLVGIKAKEPLTVIPKPWKIQRKKGYFKFENQINIKPEKNNTHARNVAILLKEFLKPHLGEIITIYGRGDKEIVLTSKGADPNLGPEGYILSISPNKIIIQSVGGPGLFYGIQTIRQLLPHEVEKKKPVKGIKWKIPCVTIIDKPRFKWRGMHLDVSRHFFTKEEIKRYIDYIALHKMNVFHWHLIDDGGWRLEIKKYPKLTSIGAWRKGTGKGWSYVDIRFLTPEERKTTPYYGGYYTQDEIREIVEYARKRYVTIVPEIEMPGHTYPSVFAYPELAAGTKEQWEAHLKKRGIWNAYDPGKEIVYEFLQNVLLEVFDLFPSKYIHIGGDEVRKWLWKDSPYVKKLMEKEGLKNLDEVQSYFIKRIEKFINAHGRKLIGWDEILQGGLSPNATVMSWRGIRGGIASAKMGHDAVMTPTSPCYFDYSYKTNSTEKVYNWEPVPKELNEKEAKHILGGQGNVWTEWMENFQRVEFMIFPRMIALAEVLWDTTRKKDWPEFKTRLERYLARLESLGVRYYISPPKPKFNAYLFKENCKVEFEKPITPNFIIRYTLGGSNPTMDSPVYKDPIILNKSTVIKAALFTLSGNRSEIISVHCIKFKPYIKKNLVQGILAKIAYGSFQKTTKIKEDLFKETKYLKTFNAKIAKRGTDFAISFEGYIDIKVKGIYTFYLGSDDGSVLLIGPAVIVNNDGPHGMRWKKGSIYLDKGIYPLKLKFFQLGGPYHLKVLMEGPGIPKGPIPDNMLKRGKDK